MIGERSSLLIRIAWAIFYFLIFWPAIWVKRFFSTVNSFCITKDQKTYWIIKKSK